MFNNNEVGYGRPPVGSRFKPGQSGNPKGRPRGTKNLKTDLHEELQEKIVVHEGERTLRISKQRAIIKTLFAKTLKGDGRAAHTLLNLLLRTAAADGGSPEIDSPFTADETELLDGLVEELLLRKACVPKSASDPDRAGSAS